MSYAMHVKKEETMATIRRREGANGVSYNVQIRIRPYPPTTKSFKKLTDAKRWAETTEMEMRDGKYGMIMESKRQTLAHAIDRYQKHILPKKKKSKREYIVQWWKEKLGHLTLNEITPALIAKIRDDLINEEVSGKKRASATILKYLVTLSHIFSMCIKEWHWIESNPVMRVTKPSLPKGRTRFLDDDERKRLLEECQKSKNLYLYTIVVLDISTGMRRSEILNLKWQDIDFERERIVLHETKNGEVRVLPLVGLAHKLINQMKDQQRNNTSLLFPSQKDPKKPIDFRSAWRVVVKNAGLENFKFHDLRHSFASYCVMNGSSLNEIADLLGHKSYQSITKRYCHLSDAYRKDVVSSMNEKIFGV